MCPCQSASAYEKVIEYLATRKRRCNVQMQIDEYYKKFFSESPITNEEGKKQQKQSSNTDILEQVLLSKTKKGNDHFSQIHRTKQLLY